MKRLLLILILLLPQLLAAQLGCAVYPVHRLDQAVGGRRPGREYAIETVDRDSLGLDTLRRLDAMGGELMTLRGDGREGSVVLEVAGFGLTLGRAPETDSQADLVMRSGRVKLYFFNSGEFGFTLVESMSTKYPTRVATTVATAAMPPKRKGFWIRNWGIRSTAPLR